MSPHTVFYGQKKSVSIRIHTPKHPLRPQGVPSPSKLVRSRWASEDLCLPTAWHFIQRRAQYASPASGHAPDLSVYPDHQNAVRPLALTSSFHFHPQTPPLLPPCVIAVFPQSCFSKRGIRCCSDRLDTVFVRIFMITGLRRVRGFTPDGFWAHRRHRRSPFKTLFRSAWEPRRQPPCLSSA